MPDRWQFNILARILHWTMAAMILTMLFIGVAQVASLADYHLLLSIHRPLGIAVLILVVLRFLNRKLSTLPAFPATMSHTERRVAKVSEYLMYSLMFVLPLVGWGMLSAAHYPIVMFGSIYLPWILPQNLELYSVLRQMHTVLAFLFFATFIAHFGAILFHTFIVRDGLIGRMVPWKVDRPAKSYSAEPH